MVDVAVPLAFEAEATVAEEALKEANEAGRGTVVVNERLIEQHNVRAAEKLLMLRDAIKELENE